MTQFSSVIGLPIGGKRLSLRQRCTEKMKQSVVVDSRSADRTEHRSAHRSKQRSARCSCGVPLLQNKKQEHISTVPRYSKNH